MEGVPPNRYLQYLGFLLIKRTGHPPHKMGKPPYKEGPPTSQGGANPLKRRKFDTYGTEELKITASMLIVSISIYN